MNNNQHILVTFNTNWADEMDITGFRVFTQAEWDAEWSALSPSAFPMEVYFGTNESNEYDTKEDLLAEYTLTPISFEEAVMLDKLFDGNFGECPLPSDFVEEEEDEEDTTSYYDLDGGAGKGYEKYIGYTGE